MSWWVKEISTITEDQSERLCIIETDTPNDLPNPVRTKPDPDNPGQTITDYTIVRGSEAYCLSNSKTYKLNSQGNWIEQTDGSGGGGGASSADQVSYDNTDSGLTATNVQDAIDEIKDLDDMQDRALTELYGEDANQQLEINYAINTGSKNVLKFNNDVGYTLTTHGRTFEVLADGGVKITGDTPDTSYADFYVAGTWGNREPILNATEDDNILSLKCSDPLQTENLYIRAVDRRTGSTANTATARLNQEEEFNFPITTVLITVRPDVVLPSGGITVYPMIRNKVIRNSTFEPYAPTNRELYEISQTKADKGTFDLTIAGSPLVTSEYSYSCIVTGDIATVCIRLILADALDVNTSRNLFKIPVGYRPPQAVAGTGYADGKLRVFWINTSGDVKIRIDEAIPAGASINVNFCYSYNPTNWTTVTANQLQSLNSPLTLNLNRNELNEQLDSNFDLIDSIPEEEEGEEDV